MTLLTKKWTWPYLLLNVIIFSLISTVNSLSNLFTFCSNYSYSFSEKPNALKCRYLLRFQCSTHWFLNCTSMMVLFYDSSSTSNAQPLAQDNCALSVSFLAVQPLSFQVPHSFAWAQEAHAPHQWFSWQFTPKWNLALLKVIVMYLAVVLFRENL